MILPYLLTEFVDRQAVPRRLADFSDDQLLLLAIWYVKQTNHDPSDFAEDVAVVLEALRNHFGGESDACL